MTKHWTGDKSYSVEEVHRDRSATGRNRIVVDSGIICWAVRYCLGRLSYAAADGYRLVIDCAPQLDDNAIACLRRDIEEALDEPWPRGYGDLQDGWASALAALEREAEQRIIEGGNR